MPFSQTEDSLWYKFDEWVGEGSVKAVRLITDRDSGRPKGYGYVEFNTAEQATKAIGFTGTDLDGREVRIDISTPRPENSNPRREQNNRSTGPTNPPADTLFIGNLSFETYDYSVREIFEAHGEIYSVRLPTDRDTGAPKG